MSQAQFSPLSTHDFGTLRHIGPSKTDQQQMLTAIGASDLEQLIDETLPASIRQKAIFEWHAMSEHAFLKHAGEIAGRNKILTSLIGQGFYGTVTPPVIQRNILENPAWYTAYTPYQPEISQGRLEALLNFQTIVSDLTGLDIANASLLDEATACAEAMAMAHRVSKSKSSTFFVDENCHPQNISVMRTRAEPLGIDIVVGEPSALDAASFFGAIFQYPGSRGQVADFSTQVLAIKDSGGVIIYATDLLALTLLRDPGSCGADIAVGSSQRFGVPMGYGGPHAGFFACREIYKRSMPGRLVGVSVDAAGNKALRLALQTREQHIRREKAASNVCTAQALLAVMASFYGVFHGPEGLKEIARRVHYSACVLKENLSAAGFSLGDGVFFDTLEIHVGERQTEILNAALKRGINLRLVGENRICLSMDETVTVKIICAVLEAFGIEDPDLNAESGDKLETLFGRETPFMTHEVFSMGRSETEIMRYMRRLADRDLALDRAMIPLGSCTMKLNAAVEMMPVTWPEFAQLHPFVPEDQALGYSDLVADLSSMLCDITGYDAFSMQPNSGAQGEFAGLLAIAAYHASKGEIDREICLIPMSAHGTNPASAQMAGMQVVVVNTAANGDIDLDDFRAKAAEAGNRLAACMVTYPSTHGVFEETIQEVCAITHQYGGQVYLDGANLNAMVGLARPGDIGSDVSHLNLHKTFCIPHGGGGPGVGPIGVKSHLAPYLPGHPETADPSGAVSAAPYGSAAILPISWAYCKLMGSAGLTEATKIAILNANYIAASLKGDFGILYARPNGRVAHECIIDLRPFTDAGITVEDVAKRLMDYGFHAPTMSWPVAGTLMIEPTESEPKEEIDRFIAAMRSIRQEIRDVAEGTANSSDNLLKNAPHTISEVTATVWPHSYPREAAAFPNQMSKADKYWPPAARVDNVYGDRNLICSCPPLSEYSRAAE